MLKKKFQVWSILWLKEMQAMSIAYRPWQPLQDRCNCFKGSDLTMNHNSNSVELDWWWCIFVLNEKLIFVLLSFYFPFVGMNSKSITKNGLEHTILTWAQEYQNEYQKPWGQQMRTLICVIPLELNYGKLLLHFLKYSLYLSRMLHVLKL